MFAYYLIVFGNRVQLLSRVLRKVAITNFTVMCFVCFNRAAEFKVSHLFLSGQLHALRDEGLLCANKEVTILLSHEMKASMLDRGL